MVKVEQVQPWEGGGAGYLSQGIQEGEGSEGERIKAHRRKNMTHGNAVRCPYQRYYFSDPPVSRILAPTVWTKGSKLFCR